MFLYNDFFLTFSDFPVFFLFFIDHNVVASWRLLIQEAVVPNFWNYYPFLKSPHLTSGNVESFFMFLLPEGNKVKIKNLKSKMFLHIQGKFWHNFNSHTWNLQHKHFAFIDAGAKSYFPNYDRRISLICL